MVVGLSGVGKTFLVNILDEKLNKVQSSKVLTRAERPLYKLTNSQFVKNQYVLKFFLRGIDPKLEVILDGHTVIESKNKLFTVPEAWFEGLGLIGIICIIDHPQRIAERRRREKLFSTNIAHIDKTQRMELTNARRICARLQIPFASVLSTDKNLFVEKINRILGRQV